MNQETSELRDIINSQDDIILIIARDYGIENVNRSGLTLLDKNREDVIGEKCYQALHAKAEPCQYCPFTQTMKTKQTEVVERYDTTLGKHFRIKSTPILSERGDAVKCILSIRDVTERVNTEAKLKRMQQELNLNRRLVAIGQVAAGMTHEINNPLTGVIAFSQMLMQMDIPENMKEAVEVIFDGASRVVGIVDRLRTFARQDRPEKEYTDLNAIIGNTLAMRSYEMRSNGIEVTTHLATNLPETVANVGQLQQVLLNIIINAEQAMATSSLQKKLTITTEQVADRIRVSISDSGPGIPEEIIYRLFDPFFTTKDNTSGMGLGLNISHGIITEHGGEIRAQSEPGSGATFIIDLPIVAETREREPAKPADVEQAEPVGARILVVDDEPHICRALDRLLTKNGHQVDTTSSPLKALEMLSEAEYDLILLDLRMPDMNGIEFYDHIKAISPALQQKVVCVTGDVVSAQNEAFLHETGIPCVAKPFGVSELMRQVRHVLEGEKNDAQVTYSRS
ncbi:MAG: response regulator [Dehalococcoidales bacterium]|nr:MAG: response regulator [Dehalococcoidales bacterium]